MGKTKLQKIFSTISITSLFVVVGLVVLMIGGTIKSSRFMWDLVLIVGIVSFSCVSCLSVARYVEDKEKRIPAFIVIGLTGLTCILWIIALFVGQGFIDKIRGGTAEGANLVHTWNFIKIVIFITVQTAFANLIVTYLFWFKNRLIPFQVVMYLSNGIVDLWLSLVLLSSGFSESKGAYANLPWLYSREVITILVISFMYMMISTMLIRRFFRRKVVVTTQGYDPRMDLEVEVEDDVASKKEEEKPSVEERIKKLDNLKAGGLITEEEYNAKKAKILEDI